MEQWTLLDIQLAADRLRSQRGDGLGDELIFDQYCSDHEMRDTRDVLFLVKALADKRDE